MLAVLFKAAFSMSAEMVQVEPCPMDVWAAAVATRRLGHAERWADLHELILILYGVYRFGPAACCSALIFAADVLSTCLPLRYPLQASGLKVKASGCKG